MRNGIIRIANPVLIASAVGAAMWVNAGSLTPPAGPVAPTMKTLVEVEPRVIINSVNTPGDADSVYKITAPGSYYLIGNITGQAVKHGIEIAAGGDVTIDLMGFELVGGSDNRVEANQIFGNVIGLNVDGINNHIADNTVRENTDNYDFAAGNQLNLLLCEIPETIAWPATVKLAGSLTGISGQGGIVIDSGNVTIDLAGHALIGVPNSNDGISVGGLFTPNITIRNGSVQSWGGYGIRAHQARNLLVVDVLASGNGDSGIWGGYESTIDRCGASSNGFTGFLTQLNSRFINCTAANNVLCGFTLDAGSTITGCTASDNGLAGITATSSCYVANNNCHNNDTDGNGNGIVVKGTDSRIEANNVTGNTIGIDVNGTSNLIIRNSASGNGTAYSIVAGNSVGPFVTSANITTNGNPHANYDY